MEISNVYNYIKELPNVDDPNIENLPIDAGIWDDTKKWLSYYTNEKCICLKTPIVMSQLSVDLSVKSITSQYNLRVIAWNLNYPNREIGDLVELGFSLENTRNKSLISGKDLRVFMNQSAGFIIDNKGIIYILARNFVENESEVDDASASCKGPKNLWCIYKYDRTQTVGLRIIIKLPRLKSPLRPSLDNNSFMRIFDYESLHFYDVDLAKGSICLEFACASHNLVSHLQIGSPEFPMYRIKPSIDGKNALVMPIPIVNQSAWTLSKNNKPTVIPLSSARLGLESVFFYEEIETGVKYKYGDVAVSGHNAKWMIQFPSVSTSMQKHPNDFTRSSCGVSSDDTYHISIRSAVLDFQTDLRFIGVDAEISLFDLGNRSARTHAFNGMFLFVLLSDGCNLCLAQSATFNDPLLKSRVSWPFKAIHNENSSQIFDITFDSRNYTIFVAYDNSVRTYQIPKQWMPVLQQPELETPKTIQNKPSSAHLEIPTLDLTGNKKQKTNSSDRPSSLTKEVEIIQDLDHKKSNSLSNSYSNSNTSSSPSMSKDIQSLRAELDASHKKIASLESQLLLSQQKVQFYEETKIVFQFPKFHVDETTNALKIATAATKNIVSSSSKTGGNVSTFEINVKAPITS